MRNKNQHKNPNGGMVTEYSASVYTAIMKYFTVQLRVAVIPHNRRATENNDGLCCKLKPPIVEIAP